MGGNSILRIVQYVWRSETLVARRKYLCRKICSLESLLLGFEAILGQKKCIVGLYRKIYL